MGQYYCNEVKLKNLYIDLRFTRIDELKYLCEDIAILERVQNDLISLIAEEEMYRNRVSMLGFL